MDTTVSFSLQPSKAAILQELVKDVQGIDFDQKDSTFKVGPLPRIPPVPACLENNSVKECGATVNPWVQLEGCLRGGPFVYTTVSMDQTVLLSRKCTGHCHFLIEKVDHQSAQGQISWELEETKCDDQLWKQTVTRKAGPHLLRIERSKSAGDASSEEQSECLVLSLHEDGTFSVASSDNEWSTQVSDLKESDSEEERPLFVPLRYSEMS